MADGTDRKFDEMTLDEKILHVQDLWDRIAEEAQDFPLTDEQMAELDRRLAEDDADPSSAIPWEQVKAGLFRR